PVAIDVAIVVESPSEAAAFEFSAVEIDVGLAEPGGESRRRAWTLQKAATIGHHAEAWSFAAGRRGGARGGDSVPGCAEQHAANGRAWIALELGFGAARLLKIELIELSVLRARHCAGRLYLGARPKRHAQTDDGAEAIGTHERGLPGNGSAPVVTDNDG